MAFFDGDTQVEQTGNFVITYVYQGNQFIPVQAHEIKPSGPPAPSDPRTSFFNVPNRSATSPPTVSSFTPPILTITNPDPVPNIYDRSINEGMRVVDNKESRFKSTGRLKPTIVEDRTIVGGRTWLNKEAVKNEDGLSAQIIVPSGTATGTKIWARGFNANLPLTAKPVGFKIHLRRGALNPGANFTETANLIGCDWEPVPQNFLVFAHQITPNRVSKIVDESLSYVNDGQRDPTAGTAVQIPNLVAQGSGKRGIASNGTNIFLANATHMNKYDVNGNLITQYAISGRSWNISGNLAVNDAGTIVYGVDQLSQTYDQIRRWNLSTDTIDTILNDSTGPAPQAVENDIAAVMYIDSELWVIHFTTGGAGRIDRYNPSTGAHIAAAHNPVNYPLSRRVFGDPTAVTYDPNTQEIVSYVADIFEAQTQGYTVGIYRHAKSNLAQAQAGGLNASSFTSSLDGDAGLCVITA